MDNEYVQDPNVGYPGKAEMMRDIERELKDGGIVVPLTYNDAYQGRNFVTGIGAVDLYGLDSYPQVNPLSLSGSEAWHTMVERSIFLRSSTVRDQMYGILWLIIILISTCQQIVSM